MDATHQESRYRLLRRFRAGFLIGVRPQTGPSEESPPLFGGQQVPEGSKLPRTVRPNATQDGPFRRLRIAEPIFPAKTDSLLRVHLLPEPPNSRTLRCAYPRHDAAFFSEASSI